VVPEARRSASRDGALPAGPLLRHCSLCLITHALQEPDAINWKQWKEEGVDPQLVDSFQKAYDSEHIVDTCMQMDTLMCSLNSTHTRVEVCATRERA
jgi:hypothetical protein